MAKEIKNIGASMRARLLKLSKQPWNARTGLAAHIVGDGYARVTRKLHLGATFSRKLRGGLAESVMPKDELQMLIESAASYMQTLRALLHDFALSDEAHAIDTTDEEKFREMACEHDTTIRGTTASSPIFTNPQETRQ